MANKMNSTKVVTGVVRLSYANVWEPASINGSNPKYSVSLIIPKSDKQTLDAIDEAVNVWRWNVGGLGFSHNGYNGPYETAITADGQIVADFITSGSLVANINLCRWCFHLLYH